MKSCRTSVKSLRKYVNSKTYAKLLPTEANKKSYGILKRHKNLMPLRPIVSSINSLVDGCESFLFQTIKNLEKNCTFSIESTKELKKTFFWKIGLNMTAKPTRL